jgi:hypothetical protein
VPAVLPTLLALVVAAAPVLTTTPTPLDAACPAPAQLAAALNGVVPGIAPGAPTALPIGLANGARLAVMTTAESDVRVLVLDERGEVALHRILPAPPRGHSADCAALAETIALIVDRYLHDIGYEAPSLPAPAPAPPPPVAPPPIETPPLAVTATPAPRAAPPPRALWRLGAAAGARLGDAGGLDGQGELAFGVESTAAGPRWGGRLSVGFAPPADAHWSEAATSKTATLQRIPTRLGIYLSLRAGPGRLEPGLGAGADVFHISAGGPGTVSGIHVAPSGDAALAYAIHLTDSLYVRLLSRVALTVPYDFNDLHGDRVWETPRVYGEAGVELGVAFR